MASQRDTKVAAATTKLGRAIASALRSWAQEVGADDIANDMMDRVREGLDVVRDRASEAASNARTRASKRARKTRSTKATKKARKNVRSTATRKTKAKKKTVLKKR
jgi:hypothetical protein